MGYDSVTIYQDATAFNNAGMLYAAQFRPNVTTIQDADLAPPLHVQFAAKYSSYKGYDEMLKMHTFLNPPERNKGGFTSLFKTMDLKDASPGNSLQIINLGKIPTTGGELMMRSAKSVGDKAQEGAFIVKQFSEPAQTYKSIARTYNRIPGVVSQDNVFSCFEFIDGSGVYNISAFTSTTGSNSPDFAWYDMTWGVALYDYTSTFNAPNDYVAPLCIKRIFGIEVQPVAGSILQPVAQTPPDYDVRALTKANSILRAKPDSLPAKANSLGSLISMALKYAPAVIDLFSKTDSKIEGKKEKKATTKKVEKKVERAVEKKVERSFPGPSMGGRRPRYRPQTTRPNIERTYNTATQQPTRNSNRGRRQRPRKLTKADWADYQPKGAVDPNYRY